MAPFSKVGLINLFRTIILCFLWDLLISFNRPFLTVGLINLFWIIILCFLQELGWTNFSWIPVVLTRGHGLWVSVHFHASRSRLDSRLLRALGTFTFCGLGISSKGSYLTSGSWACISVSGIGFSLTVCGYCEFLLQYHNPWFWILLVFSNLGFGKSPIIAMVFSPPSMWKLFIRMLSGLWNFWWWFNEFSGPFGNFSSVRIWVSLGCPMGWSP